MQRFQAFHDLVDRSIKHTWEHSDFLNALSTGAQEMSDLIVEVGEGAAQNLNAEERDGATDLTDFLIHFEWAEQAKNFLILWRDILFEHQKAELFLLDGQVEAQAVSDLKAHSLTAIKDAASTLKSFPEKKANEIRSSRRGEKKQLEDWQLQTNPWPSYRKQFENIAEQCANLIAQYLSLKKTSGSLNDIRTLVEEAMISCQAEIKIFKDTAEDIDAFIKANESEPAKVAKHLEEQEGNLKMTSFGSTFTHTLDEKIKSLEERLQIPISVDGGLINQRDIPMRRRCRQWLEAEVLPVLYEIWELTERTGNSLKMSLVNIRNRAILLSQNEVENGQGNVDLCQPIHAFLKIAVDNEKELVPLQKEASLRLSTQFQLSELFQPREFLPIPLQSTIEQMRLDQSPFLTRIRDWSQRLNNRLREVRSDVVQESVLSKSERIVRFVKERTPEKDNIHYSNIFLTKGYIGESFVVGREDELAHVRKIVNNWRLGFRGAVILSGQRFSGKSLFGELVANRHFIGHTVRLAPNSPLQVGSRKMTTSFDLGEALSFIEKHTLGDRMLIWLDDLELWTNATIPLSQNVRRLCQSIDSLSDRLFFMVSMSNWCREHFDRFHGISRVFQAEVSMDQMSAAETRQAILIRHGATHLSLVDEHGKEINPQQFQKMTDRIFKSSHGIIGDALNQWSACTYRVDDERVMHVASPGNALPNFLRPDNVILLRTLLLEKRTNEYRLRRIFGPAFKDKYGGILQRLLRTGLLTRQLDGWLEINEVAVNEVGRMVYGE